MRTLATAILLICATAACDDTTEPDTPANVEVAFALADSADGGPLVVTGTNGTLTITDIRFIVNEFELEREVDACNSFDAGTDDEDDDCEKFEGGPSFVRLLLDGEASTVVSQQVPPGRYSELSFEIEDLEDDRDDEHAAEIQALLAQVRTEFPEWPRNASMVVIGDFDGKPFKVFLEAEIEIETFFPSALVVDGGDRSVTIEVNPAFWFRNANGSVVDFSLYDFATTGRVLEFEAEIEEGFLEAEFD